mgnify:CR=1 FL=1
MIIKVVYREAVNTEKCPEGNTWREIQSPCVSITQMSISRTGVVWGVTWEGIAVVRIGITYHEPTGKLRCFVLVSYCLNPLVS